MAAAKNEKNLQRRKRAKNKRDRDASFALDDPAATRPGYAGRAPRNLDDWDDAAGRGKSKSPEKKSKKKKKDRQKPGKEQRVDLDDQMDKLYGPDTSKIKSSLPKKQLEKLERQNERKFKESQLEARMKYEKEQATPVEDVSSHRNSFVNYGGVEDLDKSDFKNSVVGKQGHHALGHFDSGRMRKDKKELNKRMKATTQGNNRGTLSMKGKLEDAYGSEYQYEIFSNDEDNYAEFYRKERKTKNRVTIDEPDNYDTDAKKTYTKGQLKTTLSEMMNNMTR